MTADYFVAVRIIRLPLFSDTARSVAKIELSGFEPGPPFPLGHCFCNKHSCTIFFSVIPCFILERKDANPDDPILMMEVALTGTFEKYLVNDGSATKQGLETEHGKICLAFAHWTFEYTEEELVVTDLQGNV